VVAFDETVWYPVRKACSWKSTVLGGESLVADFVGPRPGVAADKQQQ
jgi:uncharacterized protein (AIM24 family)